MGPAAITLGFLVFTHEASERREKRGGDMVLDTLEIMMRILNIS